MELARTLHPVLRQIIVDGVFHADPYPGNVLISAEGRYRGTVAGANANRATVAGV